MYRIPRAARALVLAIACAALLATFAGSALATDERSLGVATTTTTPQTCGPDGCGELGCTVTADPGSMTASTTNSDPGSMDASITSPDLSAPPTRQSSPAVDTSTALVLAPKKVKTCITITVAFSPGPLNARKPFVQSFTATPNNKNLDFDAVFENPGRTPVAVRFKPGSGVSMADCGAPGARLIDRDAITLNEAFPPNSNQRFKFTTGRNETIAFVDKHGYQRFTVSVTCDVPE